MKLVMKKQNAALKILLFDQKIQNEFIINVVIAGRNNEHFSITGNDDFESAKSSCESQGGHLPVVEHKHDMGPLVAVMKTNRIQTAWLGIRKTNKGGLKWMDGTDIGKY